MKMKFLKLIPILFIFFGNVPYKNEVQAEDGIRDVHGSRGLGDVYKRQLQIHLPTFFNAFSSS